MNPVEFGKSRQRLLSIATNYPLALARVWVPHCHRWDGFGIKSDRIRGCGRPMRRLSAGVYRCDHCDIEEVRTSQFEALNRLNDTPEAFLATGGNRAGKTELGAMLAIATAAGSDVWWVRQWLELNNLPIDLVPKKPSTVWYAALSYGDALEYGRPKLERYAPAGTKYTRWRAQDRASLKLPNGGRVVSLSCDAGREKFQGAAVSMVWIDEEPTDVGIFEECLLRIIDKRGKVLITATPLKGLTFLYDIFVDDQPQGFDHYAISGLDNPYVSSPKLRRAVSHLSEASQQARLFGAFTSQSGLVYPEFDRTVHICKPFDIPDEWERDVCIDFGVRNPFAALWVAHDTKNDVLYVYREYYKTEKTTLENGRMLLALGAKDGPLRFVVADPESKDGRLLLARELGIYTKKAPKHYGVSETINMVKDRLKLDAEGRPALVVFATCRELIKEFRKYKWSKTKGKDRPDKQFDHGLDALRYLCAFLYRFKKLKS